MTEMMPPTNYVDVSQLAPYVQKRVAELIAQNLLQARQVSGKTYVSAEELNAYAAPGSDLDDNLKS